MTGMESVQFTVCEGVLGKRVFGALDSDVRGRVDTNAWTVNSIRYCMHAGTNVCASRLREGCRLQKAELSLAKPQRPRSVYQKYYWPCWPQYR